MDGVIVQSGYHYWCVADDSINVANLTVKSGGSQTFRSDRVVIGPNSTIENGGFLSVVTGSGIYKHIKDVDTNDEVQASEIVTDQNGRKIAITKMRIVFIPDATLQQMNQLLGQLNATITSSVNYSRGIVVRIPKPASMAEYLTLIDQIEAKSYVDFVSVGDMGELSELPSNIESTDATEMEHIDNQLAIRAHAAWNARQAINSVPKVVVADRFGKGIPSSTMYNAYSLFDGSFKTEASLTSLTGHGYGVLGVIAGSYGQFFTTGIYPDEISLGIIDGKLGSGIDMATFDNKIIKLLRDNPGNMVLNTSINYTGTTSLPFYYPRRDASYWIEKVRTNGLEERIVHVTSAGNCDGNTYPNNDAKTKSTYAAARLLDGIKDSSGNSLKNLKNTIVVENAFNTPADTALDQPITIECLSATSYTGGDVSGIGATVYTYTGTGTAQTQKSGTSFSSPQVAGLAAYIWSIAPSLTPKQIITLIKETAEPIDWYNNGLGWCRIDTPAAPFVDAYEALLSLDAVNPPTKNNSPVRFALLDVNNDNAFNEDDVTLFYNRYYPSDNPTTTGNDFSRYDLNGDGWTSPGKSSEPTAFDLDRSGSVQYGKPTLTEEVTQIISGTEQTFNENRVSDKDILCYYAYSPLYTGDTTTRDDLIKDRCLETVMYNGLMWGRGEGISYNRSGSISHCKDSELAGFTDWRLPTVDELKGIVYCSNNKPTPLQENESCGSGGWGEYSSPTIDLTEFSCALDSYWTVTPYGNNSTYWGYAINFRFGNRTILPQSSNVRTRCVRTP